MRGFSRSESRWQERPFEWSTPEEVPIEAPHMVYSLLLESVHHWTGLPWWAVVPGLAFSLRALLNPLLKKQKDRRHQLVGPLRDQLSQVFKTAYAGWLEASSMSAKGAVVRKWWRDRGVVLNKCGHGHFSRNKYMYLYAALIYFQLWGVRHCIIMDPSFAREGALWFPSLLDHDVWQRLNLLTAGLSIAIVPFPKSPLDRVGYATICFAWCLIIPFAHVFSMPEGNGIRSLCGQHNSHRGTQQTDDGERDATPCQSDLGGVSRYTLAPLLVQDSSPLPPRHQETRAHFLFAPNAGVRRGPPSVRWCPVARL